MVCSGLRRVCSCLDSLSVSTDKQPSEYSALQILVESGVWQLSGVAHLETLEVTLREAGPLEGRPGGILIRSD